MSLIIKIIFSYLTTYLLFLLYQENLLILKISFQHSNTEFTNQHQIEKNKLQQKSEKWNP